MNTYTKIGFATLTIPFLLTSCNIPLETKEIPDNNQSNITSGEEKHERRRGRENEWNQNQLPLESTEINQTQIISNTGNTTIKKSSSYRTPSGTITTTFSIGLSEDKTITSLTASTNASDHHDQQYHSRFNRSVDMLIGKKLNEVNIDSIGGATLTTEAFMKAIQVL